MKHFYQHQDYSGYSEIVPENSGLELIKFGLVKLEKGQSTESSSGDYEIALVILSGKCNIECDDTVFEDLGSRNNVFSGKPTTVYIPKESQYKIVSTGERLLEIGVCMVKAETRYKPFVISPEDVVVQHRGQMNWQRDVLDIITDKYEGMVDRIILGEVHSHPGQWSSYPPHKHDQDNRPNEVNMEEIYHFRTNPNQGFGIQVLYNDDLSLNETYTIRDGDTIAIKVGYHPVAAAPGYQLYYLWIMAGNNGRALAPYDDPKHVWLKAVEKMV